MISIQTNVNSLVAQQNLSVNSAFQSKTIAQLTSGYRINQSGDDAAGLAVANQFRSTVAELTQGVANGNDATAQLQIMDGGMSNISSILDRLKTLATQSASGTFTGNRATLNSEFQNALSEVDRQAQSIGLNTGGLFAKNLDVYMGTGSGSQTVQNGVVTLGLTQSAVDSQSLGMRGMQAVNLTSGALGSNNTGTDLGTTSATSVQNIVGNISGANLNQQATAGYAALQFTGAGFSDAGKIGISVNLTGVTDVATLAAAVNTAIQAAGNGITAAATAFKNANIVASVHTDSVGGQQLAFSSGTAAFQVQAGDQMANALLGNMAVGSGVAQGIAVAATAATTVTGATTLAGTFASTDIVKVVITGGGLASPVTLQVNLGTLGLSTSGAITDLESQFLANAQLQAAGLSMSGSATVGSQLSFSTGSGQGFNIQVTGDKANLLGLGSFLTDTAGNADYKAITAAAAYDATALTGTATSTGLANGLEISLNGGASTALTAIDLTTGAHALAASKTSTASIGAGGVDITAANQNLDITVTNNGVSTNELIALDTNQVATSGAKISAGAGWVQSTYTSKTVSAAALNNSFTVAVDGGTAQTITLKDGTYTTAASFLAAVNDAIANTNGGTNTGGDMHLALTAKYADVGSLPAGVGTGALTLTSALTTGVASSVRVAAATTATKGTVTSLGGGTPLTALNAGLVAGTFSVTAAAGNNKFMVSKDGAAAVQITIADSTTYNATTFLAAVNAATGMPAGVTASWALTGVETVGNGTGALTLTSSTLGAASSVAVSAATYATAAVQTSTVTNPSGTVLNPTPIVTSAGHQAFDFSLDGGVTHTATVAIASYSDSTVFLAAIQSALDGSGVGTGNVTASYNAAHNLILTDTSATTGIASSINLSATSGDDGLTAKFGFTASIQRGNAAAVNGGLAKAGFSTVTPANGNSAATNTGLGATMGLTAGMGSGAADAPATAASIAAQIQTQFGGTALVTVSNDYKISIASTTKGANSSVVINAPAALNSANATLNFATGTVLGVNSSIADIVDNLNAQFAASSTFQAAGLTASATLGDGTGSGNFVTIRSADNTQFRLNSVGAAAAASAGAMASTVTSANIVTSPITVSAANHTNMFNIAIDGGSAIAVTVGDGVYSNAATFLAAVNAGIAGSALTGLVTASWDATTGALKLTSATTGATSTVATSAFTYASNAVQTSSLTAAGDVITSTTIDATNNKISIDVGGGPVILTLGSATYTSAAALVAALTTAIANAPGGTQAANLNASFDALTHHLVLTSTVTTGVASTLTLATGAQTALGTLGFTPSTQTGLAAAVNAGMVNLGLAAGTNSGHQALVTENTGFGVAGTTFTTAAPTSTGTTMSALDAFGITNSTAFTFAAMKYGSDKQALTFSATDANGVLETKTITLQNSTALGANRAGVSIDDAAAYINQQLQQSTSNPALQKIVAVKENVGGTEKINFVSSLSNFTVAVAATANLDGLNGGLATQQNSTANGTGANMAIETQSGAKAAVAALVGAVAALGDAQAAVGKGQNQLSYAVSLAQSQITNFSAAESVIRDANVAQQAANLSKAQVLTQASIAAMAQANSAPQAVLSLLRG
jgi:flagellin